ncbi:MAG: hypothetical protein QF632_01290 [Candidatus Woesearchaeota archaeon]|jgi:predicted HTH domain antitoxin|nr:hypothetical protein [Candidatus Woesearchaeota archaeon]
MDGQVRKGLLKSLKKMVLAVNRDDAEALREISISSVQQAGIFQDKNSVSLAVVGYALSKVSHRCTIQCDDQWKRSKGRIIRDMDQAIRILKGNNEEGYRVIIKDLLKNIGRMDKKLGMYIEEVVEKARIKKGSALHKHGISVGRASELLGVSQWELLDYVGKTTLTEFTDEEIPIKKRLAFAKELFGL